MTTDDVLARARAALDGVTDGPWLSRDPYDEDGELNHSVEVYAEIPGNRIAYYSIAEVQSRSGDEEDPEMIANTEFIAWAREGVPELVAALDRIGEIAGDPLGVSSDDEARYPDDIVERVLILAAERDDYGHDYATTQRDYEDACRALGRDKKEIVEAAHQLRNRVFAQRDEARTEAEQLRAQIEQARELHQGAWSCGNPRHTNPEIGCPDCSLSCGTCEEPMPCPTIQALDGEA